jgi:hypothetical protein
MTEPFTLTSSISANEFAGVSVRISLRRDFTLYIAMLFGIFFPFVHSFSRDSGIYLFKWSGAVSRRRPGCTVALAKG